jgi:excisionase family DNA binding protein
MEPIHGIDQESSKAQDRRGLLTPQEIASYLQISDKTIYKWSSQGRIPCIKFSKKCVRFDLEKVRNWYASMEQKGRRTKRVELSD